MEEQHEQKRIKGNIYQCKGNRCEIHRREHQTEGSSQPEIIINPNANFDAKFDYYMEAYDDDLILIAAKGKKDNQNHGSRAGKQFRGHRVSVDWRKGQRLERTHCSSNRQSL